MKIVITGANGQLGRSLMDSVKEYQDLTIIPTDINELDITNEKEVEEFLISNKPDFLVNCAAYTAVDRAESDITGAEKLNSDAPGILAEKLKVTGGKMIQISTDYVFDGNKTGEYLENDPVNPQSVYGRTKVEGDQKVLTIPGNIVIRTSWLYSIYGNNFFKTMIRLMNEKEELSIVNDQYGSPTWAGDLADAILKVIKFHEEHDDLSGIYHYGNEGKTNWLGFAEEIAALINSPCRLRGIPAIEYPVPAKRPGNSYMSKEKIKETFGIEIPFWKDSLKLCYHYYKKL